MVFLYVLLPTFFIVAYQTRQHFQEVPYERIRRRMGHRKRRGKTVRSIKKIFTAKRRLTYVTIGSVVGGIYITVVWLHATPFIGAIIGGILPYLISEIWKEHWMDRYEEGVIQALEYGAGVFEAGATVEQWVKEVGDEVEGPVVNVYENGKQQVESNQFSVVDWLRYTADATPSKYFSYVLYGIIANYEQASNLNEYMREVLDEINHKRRYERAMRQQRDKAMKLLVTISFAPIAVYMMFSSPINAYLAANFTGNLVFGAGLSGYVVILLFARRTASAKPKV